MMMMIKIIKKIYHFNLTKKKEEEEEEKEGKTRYINIYLIKILGLFAC